MILIMNNILLYIFIGLFILTGCIGIDGEENVSFDSNNIAADTLSNADEIYHYIKHYDSIGDESTALMLRQEYGCIMRKMSQLEVAIEMHDACIVSAAKIKDTIQLVKALNNQAVNYCIVGNIHEAQKHYNIALMLCGGVLDENLKNELQDKLFLIETQDETSDLDTKLWTTTAMLLVIGCIYILFTKQRQKTGRKKLNFHRKTLYQPHSYAEIIIDIIHKFCHHTSPDRLSRHEEAGEFTVNYENAELQKIIAEMTELNKEKTKNIENDRMPRIVNNTKTDNAPYPKEEYILIAEHDNNMALLITSVFENNGYHCKLVADITTAWQFIQQQPPIALIIDIMLLTTNEIEFINDAENNVLFKRAPIILTSAQADDKSLIDKIPNNIECYFGKPFIPEELLLKACRLMKKKFPLQNMENFKLIPKSTTDKNKEFIEKIDKYIHENIMRNDLNATMLAKHMLISVVTLNRKMNTIANTNTTNYIRRCRLQRAKFMLMNTNMTMGEIQAMCGFESPSYFSRAFKTEYGVSPSEFRKK